MGAHEQSGPWECRGKCIQLLYPHVSSAAWGERRFTVCCCNRFFYTLTSFVSSLNQCEISLPELATIGFNKMSPETTENRDKLISDVNDC